MPALSKVVLTLRLRGRRLALGRYRLTLGARDAAGNVAAPLMRTFRVIR